MVCWVQLVTWSLIVVIVYFVVRKIISRLRIDRYTDVYVLITGCDTGFGNEAAKRFDRIGCHVFAGCLTEKGRESLKQECSDRLHAISLDVSKIESIQEAYDYVKVNLPKGRGLWGVINNAGFIGKVGPLEWLSADDYREVLNVNLYGLINVTTTFLPLVKKARGRIVNTSSMAGRLSIPGVTPYCVSKYGIEAFTDGLRFVCYYDQQTIVRIRRSLRPYGVKAVLIEPGAHKTPLASTQNYQTQLTAAWNSASSAAKEEYGEGFLQEALEYFAKLTKPSLMGNVSDVVDAYEQGLLGRFPRARYPVGKDCYTFYLPIMAMPEWLGDWLIEILTNSPKPHVHS